MRNLRTHRRAVLALAAAALCGATAAQAQEKPATLLVPAPPTPLAESAKFFGAETARYRRIARDINLQAQ